MKLKHDCVRDILIYCEDNLIFGENLSWLPISLETFCRELPKHSREDISYTLYLLTEANYLESQITESDSGIYGILVYRITYIGHEFIDTIRPDTVWKKIQKSITTLGSASLPVIQSLGTQIANELMTRL